jgi:hypothetical protein
VILLQFGATKNERFSSRLRSPSWCGNFQSRSKDGESVGSWRFSIENGAVDRQSLIVNQLQIAN